MQELLDILKNPFVLLVAVSYGLSALGGVLSRASKKAAERKKQGDGRRRQEEAAGHRQPRREPEARQARAEPAARQARAPAVPTEARDIAREIRRAMGLEAMETIQPEPEPVPARPEPPPEVIVEAARQRGNLREELAAKGLRDDARRESQISSGSAIGDRTLDRYKPRIRGSGVAARVARRPAVRMVDLHRPAEAIVAMEIFGRPVALRPPGAGPAAL